MAESSGSDEVVMCSERAWRAGVVAALVVLPICGLAAAAIAVRYGALTLVASALVVPSILLLVVVVVQRSVAALERPVGEPALHPRIIGHH